MKELRGQKAFLEIKDRYEQKDFERKVALAELRFELAVRLATLMDTFAEKRHIERCQILGVKYTPVENRNEKAQKLIVNAIQRQSSKVFKKKT